MTRILVGAVCLVLTLQSCAGMSNSLGNSANSSGNSANSSGNSGNSSRTSASGNSSGQSGASSGQSNASSQNSSASSQQSSNTSQNSATSVESSQATTAASTNAPITSIVAGSALLLGVSGGILSTVLTAKHRREAKLERERLKQLQQPQPQPMPYPVQPIPLEPGVNQPPPTPLPPPPPMPPPASPPPKPKRTELIDEGPTLDAMVMARAWLLANQLQLSQDLALGAGPTIDDLAGIVGIAPAHRERFGRLLQKHRAQLVFSRDVTPAEAALVMSRVGDVLVADPILRAELPLAERK